MTYVIYSKETNEIIDIFSFTDKELEAYLANNPDHYAEEDEFEDDMFYEDDDEYEDDEFDNFDSLSDWNQ